MAKNTEPTEKPIESFEDLVAAFLALQTQHNELKKQILERGKLPAAERIAALEDIARLVGDLFADMQLGVFKSGSLEPLKELKAAVAKVVVVKEIKHAA